MKPQRLVTVKYNNTYQLLRAVLIGIVVGLVISLFRLAIQGNLQLVTKLFTYFHHHPQWLVVYAFGSIVIGWLLGRMSQRHPDIKGSGIPQVEGQLMGEYDLAWWPVFWRKLVGGIIGIGSGLFLGREGPSIQLGATLGQGIGERWNLTPIERRVSIASGAAAGLAAAFNAPLASAMFIIEEVYHNFSPLVWLSVLVSAVSSNFMAMQFFGLHHDLAVGHRLSLPVDQYWHLILLGILLGLMGRLYQIVVLRLGKWTRKIKWVKPEFYPSVALLLVIPIIWWWPQTIGGGNGLVLSLTSFPLSIKLMLGLLLLRFIFSMVSYATELPGGIFLPILTLGAVLGGLYIAVMANLGLLSATYLPNFIIYAMAGYFACISKAPFTAILLIAEMVGSLSHLMPLAVVAIVAYLVVDVLQGQPVYLAMFKNFMQKQTPVFKGMTQVTTTIYAGSALADQTIAAVNWPKDCLVIGVYRGEEQIMPRGKTHLKAGDTLVVEISGEHQGENQRWVREQAQANVN
ncbi:ClC family H(+)/Cl(-) exchange transporter [Limosilactobacillus equigenerosi]|uniref:Chloride channel protein n=1 Tax=Limosilactobacillus equigenerosi DSM 18793 = JCM 14505 TaxID=1423742 RepID=A0A0R1UNU3_9LACO|nr:ClC family H(+)/Cl(-) exchange transporter [Limosilactobacillus equigenerosi]KRL94911.1 Chloride channel protein [Limosilactobacillus equigenerosi DSM 18793 = JCM 14505]